jgi:D-tyrosyl-tRNA(Tyr) deacylase
MIGIIQRVRDAKVTVEDRIIGQIGIGLVALVAVHRDDTDADVQWMTRKLISLRVFRSDTGHFDLDVTQVHGSILLISNFTVAGQTRRGRRPSLDRAASPDAGRVIFEQLLSALRATQIPIETGQFGADMQVTLTNDGPVTFIVDSAEDRYPPG